VSRYVTVSHSPPIPVPDEMLGRSVWAHGRVLRHGCTQPRCFTRTVAVRGPGRLRVPRHRSRTRRAYPRRPSSACVLQSIRQPLRPARCVVGQERFGDRGFPVEVLRPGCSPRRSSWRTTSSRLATTRVRRSPIVSAGTGAPGCCTGASEPVDEAEQTVLSQALDAEGTACELIPVARDDIQPSVAFVPRRLVL